MRYQTPAEKRELAKQLDKHWPEFLEVLKAVSAECGKVEWVEVKKND